MLFDGVFIGACKWGRTGVVKLLLDYSINIPDTQYDRSRALCLAHDNGYIEIMKILSEYFQKNNLIYSINIPDTQYDRSRAFNLAHNNGNIEDIKDIEERMKILSDYVQKFN
jgi:ABC-type metal ion transport system substrate-binding protein